VVPIDVRDSEGQLLRDPGQTSERALECSCAQALLQGVFEKLRRDYQLRMSEAAVKLAVHRMRQRFGTLLPKELLQTVERPENIDERITRLFEAFSH
jgi:hypothetical protein